MLIDFFFTLKDAKIPVSIKEFLTLLEALQKNVIDTSLDDFYYLARLTLVKDEAHYDKFDRAFGLYFKGIAANFDEKSQIPLDWLLQRMKRELTDEQRAQLEKFGYDKLMDRLAELLKEQKERHEGRSKGTTSASVKSAPATSRWRCAGCASSPAKAHTRNWRSTPPSTPRPATPASSI